MKTITKHFGRALFTALLLGCPFLATAQNDKPTVENKSTQSATDAMPRHWQFNFNHGWAIGYGCADMHDIISVGCRFNRHRYLGLATGLNINDIYYDADPSVENGSVPFIPLYVDYIRYVPFRHYYPNNSWIFGLAAGGGFYPDKTPCKSEVYTEKAAPLFKATMGIDINIKRRVGFNLGLYGQLSDISGFGVEAGLRF